MCFLLFILLSLLLPIILLFLLLLLFIIFSLGLLVMLLSVGQCPCIISLNYILNDTHSHLHVLVYFQIRWYFLSFFIVYRSYADASGAGKDVYEYVRIECPFFPHPPHWWHSLLIHNCSSLWFGIDYSNLSSSFMPLFFSIYLLIDTIAWWIFICLVFLSSLLFYFQLLLMTLLVLIP